jgi:glycosyltransferase involved in cell wall biosynthesis
MNKKFKKKICFIIYQKVRSPVMDNFSKAIYSAGYDVSIITLRHPGEAAFEVDHGRKIFRISLSGGVMKINRRKTKVEFLLKVIPILKQNRFSIIQFHHTCDYFILIRLITLIYSKSIFHITSYPIAPTILRSLKRMLMTSLQCYFLDKVVVQSEELKENWIGLRKLKKAVVIPVGFNKNEFFPMDPVQKHHKRCQMSIGDNQPVLVYSGAIAHIRNIDKLIMAFKKVTEIHKDARLVMIGGGDALLDIQVYAKSLNIEKSIIFTGRVHYSKVRELICMADIGISFVPINNNYNFNPPLKTFEFLGCGLPTIATKTESNTRIIQNGFNGILVGDKPEEVADSICKLLMDKNLQRHLSQNARNSIISYDFNSIARNNFLPLYSELVKRG